MDKPTYAAGIDISTQTVSAMLVGVREVGGKPHELLIVPEWVVSRPYGEPSEREDPRAWVRLARECLADLLAAVPDVALAQGLGVSTTFPGVFPIVRGAIDPQFVSLYDNTDDAGSSDFDDALARAESDTFNRMWPGNMAIGLAHLVKSRGLRIEDAEAIVPPNSAFAYALLHEAGRDVLPTELVSDFTQTVIGGLYDARCLRPIPDGVAALLARLIPGTDVDALRRLLPRAVPAWKNVVAPEAVGGVRRALGLPNLNAVSIGAGDSALGTLALSPDGDTIVNVRGSSDTPVLLVPALRERTTPRETVLHYPVVTALDPASSPWCAAAPILRTGRVWDWVKRLRGSECGDAELEALATQALKRRLATSGKPLRFDTALGGERAPDWDANATGSLTGLLESHEIGDIALAALEGMSARLGKCISLMESRCETRPSKLVIAGGPTRNTLWNWITQVFTGKQTFATAFSDASLLGAAMLGYAAAKDGSGDDRSVSQGLGAIARLVAGHPMICAKPVASPDPELVCSGCVASFG